MPLVSAVNASRALGGSRILVGAAMLAVPERVGGAWMGDAGTGPATAVALRGLGVRDVLIGMATIHTAADPERGYRWARTSGIGDATDVAATLAAAGSLPRSGVIGTAALAGFAAASSFAISAWMRREQA